MDREAELVPELAAGAERPDQAGLDEGRVPGAGRRGHPQRLEVVDAVAVAHHDDVLAALRVGLGIGGRHREAAAVAARGGRGRRRRRRPARSDVERGRDDDWERRRFSCYGGQRGEK